MFDKIIGFIGAGNMGSAMIGGILNASLVTTGQVIASAHSKETLDAIHSRFSIETTLSNETVAERSDILFLAVKPNKFDEVIPQIAPHVKSTCIIVSIAAGKTIAAIEKAFGKEIKLVRAMPNTPALVGEAMSALCVNAHVTEAELSEVQAIFNSFGKAEVVPETPLWACPVPPLPMSICLSRQWQTLPLLTACRGHRLTNLPPSPSTAQPKWYWRPADTPAN